MTENEDQLTAQDSGLLAEALTEVRPSPERAAALKARIMSSIADDTVQPAPVVNAPRITVRSADRRWEQRALGLEICVLHEDDRSRAALVRMAPGSFLPPHDHDMDEESLILEGDAQIGDDIYLQAGDYHFVRAGERHPIIASPNGCIVYVHGDRRMPIRISGGFLRRLAARFVPWLGQDDHHSSQ